MNLTQTLNSSIQYPTSNGSNVGTSDSLGLIIGIIAIAIAIFAYLSQSKWNKKIGNLLSTMNQYIEHQKMIEDSVRSNSLVAIRDFAGTAQWHLNNMIIQLKRKPSLQYLDELIYKEGFGNILKVTSDNILRYNENLKFLIMPSLHQEIESVGQKVRITSDLDQLSIRQRPDGYDAWIEFAKGTIKILEDTLIKTKKELGSD